MNIKKVGDTLENFLKQIELQEKGDSDVFATIYKDRLIYDHEEDAWYVFNGHIWERDTYKQVYNLIEQIALAYEVEVNKMGLQSSEGLYRFYRARINSLRKRSGIKSVLDLASAKLSLKQEWDSNPYLFAVKNGVLDLQTGELRPGKPDDYIRHCSKTEWKGLDEPAPRFQQFLSEVFNNDQSIIDFMQRLLGYALTGLAVEHVFPVFYGAEGRNGKDTLLKLICKIMGNNFASPVSKEVLLSGMKSPGASAPFLFELQGKRLVYADETSEGAAFDEGQIKMLSGGAPFQAKKLYQQPVTITPQYLLIMTTNNKPKIDADDPAIWERILLVPFEQRFIENPQQDNEHPVDKFLDAKLESESPGVLAWLVKGCLDWQQRKSFNAPESVRFATFEYKDENDSIGKFIKTEIIIDDNQRISVTKIYESYAEYCNCEGLPKLSKREFTKKLDSNGFERRRFGEGYCYVGITRKPTLEDEMEKFLELAQTNREIA